RDPSTPEVEYHHQKSGRIRIVQKKRYKNMTRVVKGFPSHDWLAVGWKEPRSSGDGFDELFDVIICDKLLAAAPIIQCLHAISGRVDEERVDVLKDSVMKECVATIVDPKLIEAASIALRQ
ncbi:leucine rich repeat-containing protein, partial [Toxoplasma gondii ARI]